MKTIVNAMLTYGIVSVPVGVSTRASRKETKFKLLHKGECGKNIKMPRTCEEHGPLNPEEVVSGFEYAKGQFIQVDEEEMAQFVVEREKVIQLGKFVPNDDVARWVEKSYFLAPNPIATTQYLLLWNAMRTQGLAGIGTASLWGRESPCAAMATENGIEFMLLFCHDEMQSASEIREKLTIGTTDGDQKLADALIGALASKLEPEEDLVSLSALRIESYLATKIEGKELPTVKATDEPEPQVDLTKALKESLAAAKEAKKKAKAKVTA